MVFFSRGTVVYVEGRRCLFLRWKNIKCPDKSSASGGLERTRAHFLAKTWPCNPAPEDDQYLDSYGALTLLADHCCY